MVWSKCELISSKDLKTLHSRPLVFSSQSHKMFLESKAIRGLAQYRALQSRLGSDVSYVESFQIVKIALDGNFAFRNNASQIVAKETLATHNPQEMCKCIYV